MKFSRVVLRICELCGYFMDPYTGCKYRCPNCGRTLDCSDVCIDTNERGDEAFVHSG
jgi:hypothetical protein